MLKIVIYKKLNFWEEYTPLLLVSLRLFKTTVTTVDNHWYPSGEGSNRSCWTKVRCWKGEGS